MTDEDRIAYLSGEDVDSLTPAERAELDEIRTLLADDAMWVEPSPSLEGRIVDAIADAAAQPGTSAAGPTDANVARLLDHRARRLRYTILATAAAILLAVGLAIGLGTRNSHSATPVQFAAALNGTPLAPRAAGQVTLTKTTGGWRIRINATGLPRRDNGAYYEAWLKNAAGVLVPIGTFNQPQNVTLWSGVPPTDFPTLTVTRQVVGGGEESSGQVVLTGAPHRIH
jgi:hypothetical protein